MRPPLDRALFPVTDAWTYLNHAGVAPLSSTVVEATNRCLAEMAVSGSLACSRQSVRAEEVRTAAADLMGVGEDEMAFIKNTTEGLGFVANGLPWQPGDRVVLPDHEFPSTLYPWLALADRGVTVDLVAPVGPGRTLPVEAYAEVIAAGPPPKVVVTSWVQFGRGWRTDLAELATIVHDAGALFCVDVIQGLGLVPARFGDWGVDFAMADAHKWLLGPSGIGVFFVRRSCLDRLVPLEPGWASVAHREQWDNRELVWHDSARRFEGGSSNVAGVEALGAAVELLTAAPVEAIWDHVTSLCDRAVDGLAGVGAEILSDRSAAGRSGIVTFSVPGQPAVAVVDALAAQGIICSPRGGGVRVSPHGYNEAAEIDHLVTAVAGLRAAGG